MTRFGNGGIKKQSAVSVNVASCVTKKNNYVLFKMIYDLEIAIPTYNRPDILKKNTLKLLEGVPKEYIKIYVEDEEQATLYNYGEKDNCILTHTKGIGEKRNYIKQHSKSRWLMQIDDDIKAIIEHNGIALSSDQVWELIIEGFKEAERSGNRLWGICPYANHFYLKKVK